MSIIGNGDDVDTWSTLSLPYQPHPAIFYWCNKFPEGPFRALSHILEFLFDILEFPFCILRHFSRSSVDANIPVAEFSFVSAKYI